MSWNGGKREWPGSRGAGAEPTNFHEERPAKAHSLQVLKEGVPGTAMPPWEVQMSDAQREAVVAYLDSLYERPVQ
jgi:cytochrome c oxidase cbb3-type subunit 2/cytochrome c oxidase cbb3-type subunit I/II